MNYAETYLYYSNLSININRDFIIELQKHSIKLIKSYYDPQFITNLSYICKLDEEYIDKDFIIELQKHSIKLIKSYYDPQFITNLSYICKLDEEYISKDFMIELQKHNVAYGYDTSQLEDYFRNISTLDNRPLSKLACAEGFAGDTECRTIAYSNICEDSSTGSTYKLPAEVEFRKRSNIDCCCINQSAQQLEKQSINDEVYMIYNTNLTGEISPESQSMS